MAGVGQCHQGPKGQVSTSQPLKGKDMLRFTPNRTTDLADIRDPDAIRVTIDTQEIAERRLFRELNERCMAGVAERISGAGTAHTQVRILAPALERREMGKYLSDEQLGWQMFLCRGRIFMEDASRIAVAAVDNYQEYLASGEKSPCEACEHKEMCDKEPPRTSRFFACGPLAKWQGRQEGYALGLQERDKLAWEIHGWILGSKPLTSIGMNEVMAESIALRLADKGIRRPE